MINFIKIGQELGDAKYGLTPKAVIDLILCSTSAHTHSTEAMDYMQVFMYVLMTQQFVP